MVVELHQSLEWDTIALYVQTSTTVRNAKVPKSTRTASLRWNLTLRVMKKEEDADSIQEDLHNAHGNRSDREAERTRWASGWTRSWSSSSKIVDHKVVDNHKTKNNRARVIKFQIKRKRLIRSIVMRWWRKPQFCKSCSQEISLNTIVKWWRTVETCQWRIWLTTSICSRKIDRIRLEFVCYCIILI